MENPTPNPFLEKNDADRTKNVGDIDRIARLDIAGMIAIFSALILPTLSQDLQLSWIGYGFATIITATAITRNCPLYRVFGISTNHVKTTDTVRLILGMSTAMSLVIFGIVAFLIGKR